MTEFGISFAPALPWAAIAALALLALGGVIAAAFGRLSGWWLRLAAYALLVLALAGPELQREDREGLTNVAFLVVDRSASTELEDREAEIEAARERLQTAIPVLSTERDPLELVTVEVESGKGTRDRGTELLTALEEASAHVAPGQIAGAVLLTDGQVHDAERLKSFPGPVHTLIAGEKDAFDLRLRLDSAPGFGIVGETVAFRITAEGLGNVPEDIGPRLPVEISIDGASPRLMALELDRTGEFEIPIKHGGPTIVDIQLATHADELTSRNNRVIATVNGVRDRLRVLLVSGEPHPGGRTWRDLLKADPAVELVHFTILRPPAKHDGTPVSELSLIAFPTHELFVEKIDSFDLIIFDRYRYRGVLSPAYLQNITNYVREGGAVLVSAGPSFSGAQSLAQTPLADILPALPSIEVIERPFRPEITELGRRHPVTAGLAGASSGENGAPGWGRWMRQVDVQPRSGNTVMSGADELPLLILDRVDEGRVALLASDHSWLWSRGFDGGGPQADLLRRVAHWLMKEPELEEEALFARADGDRLLIERRSLEDDAPGPLRATPPSGGEALVLDYEEIAPGRFQALLEDAEEGLWRLEDQSAEAVAAIGPPSPVEFANPLASTEPLAPLVKATGGAANWLADGVPDLRLVAEGRRASGRGWIGLTARDAHRVTGISLTPLLPAWLAALLISLLLLGAWLRESR
ncbi:MAG TPA: glutamine amidotransferase [Paracoccaceae bacterium]|nr:glutamine amidotransferase [Paracoccaceae bacterium]